MKIVQYYSHLNGYEYLKVHHPHLWDEIVFCITKADAAKCKTKVSKEKTMMGKSLYSPDDMNKALKTNFVAKKWQARQVNYWVTEDAKLIRQTLALPPAEQKKIISAAGKTPYRSYNQTDFVKDRVAVEVQFGKYFSVAYDLFVKHLAFYVGDVIDLGIEVVPMKSLHDEMSTGVPYYEGELYNLIREGRGVPGVPLILIGIAP